MIVISHKGNLGKTEKFLKGFSRSLILKYLDKCGREGVEALSSATPIDTGLTASSWGYEIHVDRDTYSIVWTNSNIVDGVPIAIILQYGHATGTGGYVQGRDYINPAIKPIFDRIANDVWKEIGLL